MTAYTCTVFFSFCSLNTDARCADCKLNCILLSGAPVCVVQQLLTKLHTESYLQLVIATSAPVSIKATSKDAFEKKKVEERPASRTFQSGCRHVSRSFQRSTAALSFFPRLFLFCPVEFFSFSYAREAASVDGPISPDAENEEPKRVLIVSSQTPHRFRSCHCRSPARV